MSSDRLQTTRDDAVDTNLWLASLFMLALFLLAPRPTVAQAAFEEDRNGVAIHMHEHLTRIGTIKAAIVAGRLEDVQEPAIWLAEHETVAGLPAHFSSYVAQMREYAREAAAAEELTTAAASVSKMAKTCGNCHLVNDINLEFGYDQRPNGDLQDIVSHMQRHQWAADRMWEGLIGPSDAAWSRGTDVLIDAPLHASDVSTAADDLAEINKIAHRIHALGGIGTQTMTPDARSQLYGELLGLCASCHTLLGRGPAD
jgi:mono/diheme cytochrome c family protein